MDISAKDFSSRGELEGHIASLGGLTPTEKPEHKIVGTAKELKKLHLSHGQSCWGIQVVASDFKKKKTSTKKISRGKVIKPPKLKKVDIKNSKER